MVSEEETHQDTDSLRFHPNACRTDNFAATQYLISIDIHNGKRKYRSPKIKFTSTKHICRRNTTGNDEAGAVSELLRGLEPLRVCTEE